MCVAVDIIFCIKNSYCHSWLATTATAIVIVIRSFFLCAVSTSFFWPKILKPNPKNGFCPIMFFYFHGNLLFFWFGNRVLISCFFTTYNTWVPMRLVFFGVKSSAVVRSVCVKTGTEKGTRESLKRAEESFTFWLIISCDSCVCVCLCMW